MPAEPVADPVGVALTGAGRMATVHAENIARTPGARLVAVAGGSAAPALAARWGAEVLTVEEACADPRVDAVVIASPNRFHVDYVELAAAGGKAALVEKPVDLDLDRVDALLTRVGTAAERVVVAFNRRFDPSFAAVRERLAAGDIGPLEQLVIISRDPAPPPLEYVPGSGGLFRDMTIHDLDMARFLAGDVVAVQATAQDLEPAIAALGDPSGAVVTLTTAVGALVTIVNARRNATGYDQRLEAFGPLGTLSVGNPRPTTVRASTARATAAGDAFVSHHGDRYAEAYAAEIAHLVAVARGEAAPIATLADGRAALALALAAADSARTGRTVALR